ncbi:MAG: hypothetical protein AAB372_02830 [Patescibacteria group bacterium]
MKRAHDVPLRAHGVMSGKQTLMLAVLEDALRAFRDHMTSPSSRLRLLSREAEEWIRADDCEWPFSFRNVCDVLDVDAVALRESELAWKRRELARVRRTGPVSVIKKPLLQQQLSPLQRFVIQPVSTFFWRFIAPWKS